MTQRPTAARQSSQLDKASLREAFDRASAGYDRAAVLQTRVRGELLERLELVSTRPQVILDLGCGTGHAARELKRRYRRATVIALDIAPGMLREAGRRRRLFARFTRVCGDALRLPLRTASVDLLFSNLMLQWCDELDTVLAEMRRVLKPEGFLSFSSFGPDTLRELRAAWSAVDGAQHVHQFLDMHDVGDALGRAGLREPVLDVERLELTYPDVRALVRDLKSIGAHNAALTRRRGLTGKDAWQSMTAAYETFRRNGTLPASYEVIYGAAWGAAGAPVDAGEVRIAVDAIRRAPRNGHRTRG
jgi:malonyl-CoA O-methyltransferase